MLLGQPNPESLSAMYHSRKDTCLLQTLEYLHRLDCITYSQTYGKLSGSETITRTKRYLEERQSIVERPGPPPLGTMTQLEYGLSIAEEVFQLLCLRDTLRFSPTVLIPLQTFPLENMTPGTSTESTAG